MPSIGSEQIAKKRLNKVKTALQQEAAKDNFYRFIASFITQMNKPKFYPSSFDLTIIRDWLDNLSNHNTRDMLDILLQALKSHHLTSETFGQRFTSAFFLDRKKNINVKRFKTAFIIGSAPYFSEVDSQTNVVNLFDAHGGAHAAWDIERRVFGLKLLQHLIGAGQFRIGDIVNQVEALLGKAYITPTKDCLRRFWQKGLLIIEGFAKNDAAYATTAPSHVEFETERVQLGEAFVTPNGLFHINSLIRDDIYLDEMKFATDLSDVEYHKVFDNRDQTDAFARLRATGIFVRSISDSESACVNLSKVLGVSLLGPSMTTAYNNRKSAELREWDDM